MNGAVLLGVSIGWFLLAYFVLGRRLERLFGIDCRIPTPAHTLRDGVDYEPTKPAVLFGHHFASIAGAGPIVGPVLALTYGWLPAVLWILFGCVLIGAFHDFAAMFLSVRNGGRSIGSIVEKQTGYLGRQIFLFFCFAALILVVAIFASLVSQAFIDSPPVATASILFIAMAPVFGWLTYRRGLPLWAGTLIFVPLLFLSIWAGVVFPCPALPKTVWIVFLLGYAAVASVIPVWMMLQPRDYLNAYLLYVMMLIGIAGVFVAVPGMQVSAFSDQAGLFSGTRKVFPLLFVTVACGACSGFHALVSSGTSAKQISSESHILPVSYGAMLVEGVLAILAVVSVSQFSPAEMAATPNPVSLFAKGIAVLAVKLGLPHQIGETFVALAISAFIMTTLDTATRLARFVWGEIWMCRTGRKPAVGVRKSLSGSLAATLIVVFLAGAMCFSNAAGLVWPVFGASNQLLAALTLLVVSVFLYRQGRRWLPAAVAMGFMLTISIWALGELCISNFRQSLLLTGVSGFLLVMAFVMVGLTVRIFRENKGNE